MLASNTVIVLVFFFLSLKYNNYNLSDVDLMQWKVKHILIKMNFLRV